MIKFILLPVNGRRLLESESRNHFYGAESRVVNDNGGNLPHFVRERALDLHNTGQSQRAIVQELGTGSKLPSEKFSSNYESYL